MAEKQQVLFIREDKRIKRRTIPVVGNTLQLKDELKTWYRFKRYYMNIKGVLNFWESKTRFLLIDENDALPISPYELYPDQVKTAMVDKNIQADEALNNVIMQKNKKQGNLLETALGIGIIAEFAMLCIFGLLIVAKNYDIGSMFGG